LGRSSCELIGSFHDDEGGTGDQIMGLEDAISRRFRDEVPLRIGEAVSQFAWRQGGFVQGQLHHLVADVVRNPVLDLARPGPVILKALGATGPIGRIPVIERRPGNAEFLQGSPRRSLRNRRLPA
jgi:hypothetical protein